MFSILDLDPSNPAVVLINGKAGRSRRTRKALSHMVSLAAARRWPLEFRSTQSVEDLEKQAQHAIRDGCRVLLAMGGDGTFQTLINSAIGADVILGVIPTGGGNDFAASLGLPRDPLLALEKIVYAGIQRVDLAFAKTADGRGRYFAGGGGIGLDSLAARYAGDEYRRVPGRLRYVLAALHALQGFESLVVNIEFPDGDQPSMYKKVLMASVLNTATYGGGLRLAPDAKTDDGLLDVVLLEDLNVMEIAAILPRLLASGELQTSRITRMKTKRIRMIPDRACLFHGDGELLGPAPIDIGVVPGAIQILAPARD